MNTDNDENCDEQEKAAADFNEAAQLVNDAVNMVSSVVETAEHIAARAKDPIALGRAARAAIGAALSSLADAPLPPPPPPIVRVVSRDRSASSAATPSRATASPASPPPALTKMASLFTACDKHGRLPWVNTTRCRNCRRCFHVDDPTSARAAPERCACGAQFLPSSNERKPFSAEPLCSTCFSDACAHSGGFAR